MRASRSRDHPHRHREVTGRGPEVGKGAELAKGFAKGLGLGVVVVGTGLVMISQLAPPPAPPETVATSEAEKPAQPEAAQPEAAQPAPATAQPTPQTAAPETAAESAAPQSAASQTAANVPAQETSPAEPPAAPAAEAPATASTTVVPTETPAAPAPAGDAAPAAPGAPAALAPVGALPPPPETPAAADAPPSLSSLDSALALPSPAPGPETAPAAATEPGPAGPGDALLVPGQGAGLAEPSRLPQIAAKEDQGQMPSPLPAPLPPVAPTDAGDAAPASPEPVAPRVLTPDSPGLPGAKPPESTMPTVLQPSVPGVKTNTLPHVGDAPQPEAAPPAPVEDKPIVKYARSFDATVAKPRLAILLRDLGSEGVSRAELAKLPFPVTFVIDPLAPDAREAEAAYRAAGQEVLMLANGLPEGATASDVEQTFQTLQETLPEAVGVIDEATAGFQDNRALASLVLPVIADQGRGLVTYDKGLNAADQIARRDGLPAAVIFRRLDGAGESQPTIRRYLDRAAFKAAQEGSVVVIGDTKPDTLAAILQWTIEGKAGSVALAPVTAVMGQK